MKAVLLAAAFIAQTQGTDDSWSWAQETHDQAWTAVRSRLSSSPVPDEQLRWFAEVVVDDGWGLVATVRLWRLYQGNPRVEYVAVRGDNLLGALHRLREADPAITADVAISKLPLEGGCASTCAGVAQLVERFERVSAPVLQPSYLSLHAPGFVVTVKPSLRQERTYQVDEGENKLASWCADLLKALRSCRRPLTPRCS